MTDLSPEARAILDAGRAGDDARDLERARVRRALFAKIAAGGGAALASGSAAAAAPTAASTTATGAVAASSLPLVKLLVPLAILAAGGAGGAIAWHARGATPPPHAAAFVQPAAVAPSVAPAPVAPAPVAAERATPAPHRAVAHAPIHDAPIATNRLAEETALLGAANSALRAGDASRALALLDDYDHRYPAGILREEVFATRIIARCELDAAGAAAGADAFLTRHPASPLAPRVRSSCSPR